MDHQPRRRTPLSSAGRRAITLVEVVMVVMIMGILAGVAAPRYLDAWAHSRVEGAAHRLAADLRYARSEALRTSQARAVQFVVADDTYQVPNVVDPDHPSRALAIDLGAEPYGVDIVSVDFGGRDFVKFDVYGSPDTDGFVRLQRGDRRIMVVCDALGNTTYEAW